MPSHLTASPSRWGRRRQQRQRQQQRQRHPTLPATCRRCRRREGGAALEAGVGERGGGTAPLPPVVQSVRRRRCRGSRRRHRRRVRRPCRQGHWGGTEDASQGRLGLLSWSSRVIWAVYIESSNEHSLGHRRALAGRKEWLRSPEDKTGAVSDLRLGLAERMNHVAGVPLKIRHHTPFQQHPLRRRMSGRPREEKHNLREATDHARPAGPRLVSLCSLSNTPGHPTDEPRGARWRRFVSVCGTSRLAGDCSQSRTPRLGARKNFFALDAAPLRAAANLTLRGWPVWAGCGSVRVARWM